MAIGLSGSLATLNLDSKSASGESPLVPGAAGREFLFLGQTEQEPVWRFGLLWQPTLAGEVKSIRYSQRTHKFNGIFTTPGGAPVGEVAREVSPPRMPSSFIWVGNGRGGSWPSRCSCGPVTPLIRPMASVIAGPIRPLPPGLTA